jgi:putative DeoR family transcriptional regulator (stage III sporulation protein D)
LGNEKRQRDGFVFCCRFTVLFSDKLTYTVQNPYKEMNSILNSYEEKQRCEIIADYMLEKGTTVRQAAAFFGISKSTVHKDLTTVLRHQNHALFLQVKQLLEKNKQERHFRGGEATRQKYLRLHHVDL